MTVTRLNPLWRTLAPREHHIHQETGLLRVEPRKLSGRGLNAYFRLVLLLVHCHHHGGQTDECSKREQARDPNGRIHFLLFTHVFFMYTRATG